MKFFLPWRGGRPHGYVAMLACWGLFALWCPRAEAAGSLSGRTVVVDAGHGGSDPGAVSGGLHEADITLGIARALGAELSSQGAHVVLTRMDDSTIGPPGAILTGLAQRVAVANGAGADLFVSLHVNSFTDPRMHGVLTAYGGSTGYIGSVVRPPLLIARSRLLAEEVQRSVIQRTRAQDDGLAIARFYVLGHTTMASVLIETGYLTNPAEAQMLATPAYQQSIATGIADGIAQFLASGVRATTNRSGVDAERTAPADTYVVQPGESLSQIAVRLGIDQQSLANVNGLRDLDLLLVGQTLRVTPTSTPVQTDSPNTVTMAVGSPDGATYVVQPGDTLSAIAVQLGLQMAALARANDMRRADLILAGQTLRVPQSERAPGPAVLTQPQPRAAAQPDVYVVQPGDTLSGIALRLHMREAALVTANGLRNVDLVRAGMTLRTGPLASSGAAVLAPRSMPTERASNNYTVRPGDTLSGIAVRLHVDQTLLAQINGIDDLDTLYAGQTLRIARREAEAVQSCSTAKARCAALR